MQVFPGNRLFFKCGVLLREVAAPEIRYSKTRLLRTIHWFFGAPDRQTVDVFMFDSVKTRAAIAIANRER